MTCQTNTMCAAGAGKCFSSGLIAAHAVAVARLSPTRYTLRALAGHPLRHTRRRLVMAGLVPATAEMVDLDNYGRPMAPRTPADAANIALSFPVTTEE